MRRPSIVHRNFKPWLKILYKFNLLHRKQSLALVSSFSPFYCRPHMPNNVAHLYIAHRRIWRQSYSSNSCKFLVICSDDVAKHSTAIDDTTGPIKISHRTHSVQSIWGHFRHRYSKIMAAWRRSKDDDV